MEKLKTFLSLEACFPKDPELHKYYVACACGIDSKMKLIAPTMRMRTKEASYDKIIGFVEVNCRPLPSSTKKSNNNKTIKRPYMCNLAIDKTWQRKGIASSLIHQCELLAVEKSKETMWLKVRASNLAAVKMYKKAGYRIDSSEEITEENRDGMVETMLLIMMKNLNG